MDIFQKISTREDFSCESTLGPKSPSGYFLKNIHSGVEKNTAAVVLLGAELAGAAVFLLGVVVPERVPAPFLLEVVVLADEVLCAHAFLRVCDGFGHEPVLGHPCFHD